MIIKYEHHGKIMSVKEELIGKHREYCLCYECKFYDSDSEKNCTIANALYRFDILADVTTPVFECAKFEPIN